MIGRTTWSVLVAALCVEAASGGGSIVQAAYSSLQGDQRGALGFDYLVKAGAGVELDLVPLDIGAFGIYVRRLRLMGNVVVGDNVLGKSIGLAIGCGRSSPVWRGWCARAYILDA